MILNPIWAKFLAVDLFYSIFHFIKVIRVLLFLTIFSYIIPACGPFWIDDWLLIFSQSLCLCFGDNYSVFFLANCLLNSLQNNHYSVRRHISRLFLITLTRKRYVICTTLTQQCWCVQHSFFFKKKKNENVGHINIVVH
jgi:hypothetical protein